MNATYLMEKARALDKARGELLALRRWQDTRKGYPQYELTCHLCWKGEEVSSTDEIAWRWVEELEQVLLNESAALQRDIVSHIMEGTMDEQKRGGDVSELRGTGPQDASGRQDVHSV